MQSAQVFRRIDVPLFEDGAVARDHRLVAGLFRILRVPEEIVAGEGHPVSVHVAPQAQSKLGLSGHPVHGEPKALPLEGLAVPEQPVKAHAVHARAVGLNERGVIEPLRVFAHRRHAVQRPELRAPFFPQVRRLQKVIAVHVGDHHRVNLVQPGARPQPLQRLVQKTDLEQAAVHHQRSTRVRQDQVEVRVEIRAAKFVHTGQHLPHMRHAGGTRQPILRPTGKRVHRITARQQALQPDQPFLKPIQLRRRLADHRTVGGQHQPRTIPGHLGGGIGQRPDSRAEPVVPLRVEPRVQTRALEHQIAGERQPPVTRPQQVGHRPRAVAAGVHAPELSSAPGQGVHALESPVQGHRLHRRTHVTGAVHGERIAQTHLHFAEVGGALKEGPFRLRRGHACSGRSPRGQPRRPLALLAMVVGEQHPLDPPHAQLAQTIQHAAITQINQQRGITRPQHIHVASVGPDIQVRFALRVGLLKPAGGDSRRPGQHRQTRRQQPTQGTHEQSCAVAAAPASVGMFYRAGCLDRRARGVHSGVEPPEGEIEHRGKAHPGQIRRQQPGRRTRHPGEAPRRAQDGRPQ